MTRKTNTAGSSGYTILLVDDNPDYLEATSLLLARQGHTVLTAGNGTDSLSILKNQKVDLLLIDYYMPGMTGEEIVLKLRQINPLIQIILQTGYAGEQPPHELVYRLDIQGYYDKSEGPEKLLMSVEKCLKGTLK
jgi:two-component system, cell cycle response regulator